MLSISSSSLQTPTGLFPQSKTADRKNIMTNVDVICFSHLRWDFVYQRPQHLISRVAKRQRVFFFEEPVFEEGPARLRIREERGGPLVAVPVLPHGLTPNEQIEAQRNLLDEMIFTHEVSEFITWYYAPLALKFSRHLDASLRIYDCMDQLSHFKNAPSDLRNIERQLFAMVDLVFTGGRTLYEDKKNEHPDVHCFPSSIDVSHFQKARTKLSLPLDQRDISGPKIGYVGVIDERIDYDLIAGIAKARPDWNIMMVGPVVKVDFNDLPKAPNIHYLGGKSYQELPEYLAHWDIAMLPFARNDATKFISPTKTPEYLAAGRRVVSTSIRDVVSPYADSGLVTIADTVDDFVRAIDKSLNSTATYPQFIAKVDQFLSAMSWDKTFKRMWECVEDCYYDQYIDFKPVDNMKTSSFAPPKLKSYAPSPRGMTGSLTTNLTESRH